MYISFVCKSQFILNKHTLHVPCGCIMEIPSDALNGMLMCKDLQCIWTTSEDSWSIFAFKASDTHMLWYIVIIISSGMGVSISLIVNFAQILRMWCWSQLPKAIIWLLDHLATAPFLPFRLKLVNFRHLYTSTVLPPPNNQSHDM